MNRRLHKNLFTGKYGLDLYFASQTPMQYVVTKHAQVLPQDELVFIEVNLDKILSLKGVYFADGNAASQQTKFYSDFEEAKRKIDWKIVNDPDWAEEYKSKWEFHERKRKKSAEALVPDKVEPKLFERICVYSREAKMKLKKLCATMAEEQQIILPEIRIECDQTHYFESSHLFRPQKVWDLSQYCDGTKDDNL